MLLLLRKSLTGLQKVEQICRRIRYIQENIKHDQEDSPLKVPLCCQRKYRHDNHNCRNTHCHDQAGFNHFITKNSNLESTYAPGAEIRITPTHATTA